MIHHERAQDGSSHAESWRAGSEFKEQMTATLAHELRSPLSAILTSLHALRDQRVDEATARKALDRAERQAQHMAWIVKDVLDLCRADQGKLSLRTERLDLPAVVADAIETVGPFLTARGHHLTISLPPQAVTLIADSSRLNQILANLLTNAVEYTEPGGEIHLAAEETAGAVVLRVRDNGMGITPDLLPRIFDLFQQGDRRGDKGRGGLGIGLALVRQLVEMHGGSVSASSAGLGQGSEFVVRLPRTMPTNLCDGKSHADEVSR
jgi:signal transduction histidine kinase